MGFATAGTIITDAALELGLVASQFPGGDPYASTDQNIIQLCAFLKSVGRKLVDARNWTHLRKEYTFTTQGTKGTVSGLFSASAASSIAAGVTLTDGTSTWATTASMTPIAASTWAGLGGFALVGDTCTNGGNLYVCTQQINATTSAPTGTGTAIADGDGFWRYVGAGTYFALAVLTCTAYGAYSAPIFTLNTASGSGVTGGTNKAAASAGSLTTVYGLPSDWRDMVDQSGWNRTTRLPLGGPLSAQEWQYLKGRLQGVVFTVLFRPMAQALYLYPDTNLPVGHTIALEYESSNWCGPNVTPPRDGTGPVYVWTADYPASWDIICGFDAELLKAALKLAWLKAKGFDYAHVEAEYKVALEAAIGNDTAAPVLSMVGGGAMEQPLLGERNVPITGFGS